MNQDEKDEKMKELLMDYDWQELRDLREDCVDIRDTFHLGLCAQRIRQIADHELENHNCAGAYLYLRAVADRLDWYHSHVLKLQEAEQRDKVIH